MSDLTATILSLFTADTSSSTSTASSLLDIITGGASSTSSTDSDPIGALHQAEANQTKDIAQTAQENTVQRDVKAFTTAVSGATSIKELLSNAAFQKVFLTANGLADQIGYTALVSKALLSNPKDSSSLAAQLGESETAWTSTVSTYDFYGKGLAALQDPTVISTLTNAYAEVTWRDSLDTATPGLSNALTFRGEASTITSVDQILGDPIMRDVVTTTLGLPLEIAIQPLEAQETAITNRVSISDFKNSKFVDQFINQYLIAKQSASSSTTSSSDLITLAAQARAQRRPARLICGPAASPPSPGSKGAHHGYDPPCDRRRSPGRTPGRDVACRALGCGSAAARGVADSL